MIRLWKWNVQAIVLSLGPVRIVRKESAGKVLSHIGLTAFLSGGTSGEWWIGSIPAAGDGNELKAVLTKEAFRPNGIVVLASVVANGSGIGLGAVRIARQVHGVKKVETYFLPSQPSQMSDFEIKKKIYY